MVYSGECPGEGIYVCKQCGTSIKLKTNTTEMPECPKCSGTEFTAVK